MRRVTRQVAFDTDAWTPERAAKVAALFDGMAPTWNERDGMLRHDALVDALDRGGLDRRAQVCLEIGSGTGLGTRLLRPRYATVLALDLSFEMLVRAAPDHGARVLGDAARLPLAAGSVPVVVLVNALLFPAEVDRVLAPGGQVLWVNSLGDRTPIHLPVEDVAAALPGGWNAVAATAGWGTWAVLRRADEAQR